MAIWSDIWSMESTKMSYKQKKVLFNDFSIRYSSARMRPASFKSKAGGQYPHEQAFRRPTRSKMVQK